MEAGHLTSMCFVPLPKTWSPVGTICIKQSTKQGLLLDILSSYFSFHIFALPWLSLFSFSPCGVGIGCRASANQTLSLSYTPVSPHFVSENF